jgi:flagellar motor switch protein FliN/FliY
MVDRTAGHLPDQVKLTIELGRARLAREEADKLGPASVVSLEALVDEPVDILVDGRLVPRGEVLVLDGSFCIRVTKLIARKKAA